MCQVSERLRGVSLPLIIPSIFPAKQGAGSLILPVQIKCIEDLGGLPCDGCRKLGLECKHDYVKKKPGRKNS